ncbi:MAG: hypothetical protein H6644_01400 [Caldilineaceae bacterium]|nr:hypothetical protein [Caldilineaceae bacterium]
MDDIDAVNQDDDSAGIDASTGVTTTTEAGGSFAISYTLTSAPTAAVVLTVASGDTSEATVAPAQLTFDAETWDQPQSVTVTGADDDVADGAVAFSRRDHQCRQRRPGLRRLLPWMTSTPSTRTTTPPASSCPPASRPRPRRAAASPSATR